MKYLSLELLFKLGLKLKIVLSIIDEAANLSINQPFVFVLIVLKIVKMPITRSLNVQLGLDKWCDMNIQTLGEAGIGQRLALFALKDDFIRSR